MLKKYKCPNCKKEAIVYMGSYFHCMTSRGGCDSVFHSENMVEANVLRRSVLELPRGKYIVLEGIDGCGKTSQYQRLVDGQYHIPFEFVVEPTRTNLGNVIRDLLKEDSVNQDVMALLFAADRMLLQEKINEHLERGFNVISDRSFYSSKVYQASSKYTELVNVDIMKPDMTIIIDVPAQVAADRSGRTDTFEKNLDYQRRCRHAYLDLAEKDDNMVVVDGKRRPDVVHKEILTKICGLIGGK